MKFNVPWRVKGIRPEARETAKEAARRSGMPLGDWPNAVILKQAAHQGLHGQAPGDNDFYGEDLASMQKRLDDLRGHVERMTRKGSEVYEARPRRDNPARTTDLVGRFDRRLEQFAGTSRPPPPLSPAPNVHLPPGLDHAVAEIAARQRALNNEPAQPPLQQQPRPQRPMAQAAVTPPPQAAAPEPPPMRASLPAQDLSGLQDQLRHITVQIETLRMPGVGEAITALRGELIEIGNALNEAMPRREIDAIEKQIKALNERIAEGRQSGVNHDALAGIEHGLAEVRDALLGLTPAEQLVGFHEAIDGLAHKIDMIVAQKDPDTMAQLENAVTTLRQMATHIASSDAVSALAAEVQTLGEKVDYIAHATTGGDALNNLEHQVAAIADVLSERAQEGSGVPPQLETLLQSLSDKIEQIQSSRSDDVAMGHLEDRIVKLVEKIDASESRLGQIEAIERGLSDLLVHIQEMRASKEPSGLRAETLPAVDELKHDIARTQDAVDSVHGTLAFMVDRLAKIEADIRAEGERRAAEQAEQAAQTAPAPAVGGLPMRVVREAPAEPPLPPESQHLPQAATLLEPALEPEPCPALAPELTPLELRESQIAAPEPPPPAPRSLQHAQPEPPPPPRRPTASSLPLNPDLPPDQPLEPGSGPPKFGDRIAASEAALGHAARAEPGTAGGKSTFIAAARRAARTALQQQSTSAPAPRGGEAEKAEEGGGSSPSGKLTKRMKRVFVAAGIVGLVAGGIQIAGKLELGGGHPSNAERAKTSNLEIQKREQLARDITQAPLDVSPDQTPADVAPPLAPPSSPSPTAHTAAATNPPNLGNLPATTKDDITASIAHNVTPSQPAAKQLAVPDSPHLPLAIGGPKLRSAAAAGDRDAEYEVAVRFADGRRVPSNLKEAAHWFELAANAGLVPAQFRYASMLEKGQGVKKDLAAARKLYRAAAGKGNAKAMHNLAVLYAEGVDGKPNYATAVKWFREAAEHGVTDSQYNLGVLCARGLGTDRNFKEAYKWFALAAAKGDSGSAKKRDAVGSRLGAQELAEAKRAVEAFKPKPQPAAAITVPKPHGGWDGTTAAGTPPKTKVKARPAARPQSQGPLSLGSFTAAKR